jgi:hypothetical protein
MSTKDINFPCHLKKNPLWLVLLDNVPTLILVILGILIISKFSVLTAILYGGYAIFSVIWFWWKICPYCHHFSTQACPCGYGMISSLFFKKGSGKSFKKVFRKNIIIQFPNWFIPVGVAIYLLIKEYSTGLLFFSLSFFLVGFVIIPSISKFVGCKNCEIKVDCPWMTLRLEK